MSENEEAGVKKGFEVNRGGSKKKEKIKPWVIDLEAGEALAASMSSLMPAPNIDFCHRPGHPDSYIMVKDGLPHQALPMSATGMILIPGCSRITSPQFSVP